MKHKIHKQRFTKLGSFDILLEDVMKNIKIKYPKHHDYVLSGECYLLLHSSEGKPNWYVYPNN